MEEEETSEESVTEGPIEVVELSWSGDRLKRDHTFQARRKRGGEKNSTTGAQRLPPGNNKQGYQSFQEQERGGKQFLLVSYRAK